MDEETKNLQEGFSAINTAETAESTETAKPEVREGAIPVEATSTETPEQTTEKTSEPADDVKQKADNLSKAVQAKNKTIHALKDSVKQYKEIIDDLKSELQKTKEEEKDNPFLLEEDKKSTQLEDKIKKLDRNRTDIENKLQEEEVETQVNLIDRKIADLKSHDPNLDETQLLLDVYKKTGGRVNDLSILEDVYIANKEREKRNSKKVEENRNSRATETPSVSAGVSAPKAKTIAEGFEIWERSRKK